MIRKIMATIIILLVANYICFAASNTSQTINITATVPTTSTGLSAAISKIASNGTCTATDDVWTPNQTSIDLGTLTFDTTNNIFTSPNYYAVDVGVIDNSGNEWTITHTHTNFGNPEGTHYFGQHVNVVFMRQTTTNIAGTRLSGASFNNSNNIAITKSQLKEGSTQGWLRIYYGVATGNTQAGCTDESGAVPVGLDVPAGTYSGTVTLTLTGI